MKRRKYLSVLSILAALILVMVAVIPASADKPEHTRTVQIEDGIFPLCGVDMDYHLETKLGYTMFCSERKCSGDAYHWEEDFTLTYEGRSLNFHHSSQAHFTWITYDETEGHVNGANFIGTIPGHGVVWGWVGRIVWHEDDCYYNENGDWVCPIYEELQRTGMEIYDLDTVCNYMLYGK
jgi:hypothetical protein